jgi:CRP/FNR family transcriptional regulator
MARIEDECRQSPEVCLARGLPFWERLSDEEREMIAGQVREVGFEKGQPITPEQARACLGGLVVRTGSVRIFLMSDEGKQITITRVRPGEPFMLGASCVLPSISFDVSLEAEQDTSCLIVSADALGQIFSRNPSAENYALRSVVDTLSDVMWNMQQMLFNSFDRRLAQFIYDECARTGERRVLLTHEEIARELNSAREVVSRMLRYFAKEGIVRSFRGGIEVVDYDRLRELALG